jgi:hypothetical protein
MRCGRYFGSNDFGKRNELIYIPRSQSLEGPLEFRKFSDLMENNGMHRTVNESRTIRDAAAGFNAGASVPIPELIALSGADIRARFDSLENAEQRNSFLDAIISKLGNNLGDWARFYEAVEIVHDETSYWKAKGYRSFEDFWRSKAGPSFRSFKELEDVYNFAKTACPDLFGIDFEGAKLLRRRLNGVSVSATISARRRTKKRLYSGNAEAHAAVIDALAWHNAGGTSLEYRLAKIKRDRPDIAARVLAGEFFKQLRTGHVGIDIASAEREAYGEVQRRQRHKTSVSEKVIGLIRASAKSSLARRELVEAIGEVRWLVAALQAQAKSGSKRL